MCATACMLSSEAILWSQFSILLYVIPMGGTCITMPKQQAPLFSEPSHRALSCFMIANSAWHCKAWHYKCLKAFPRASSYSSIIENQSVLYYCLSFENCICTLWVTGLLV